MNGTDPTYFLDAIDPNPYQTREHDDVTHIHGLARDIAQRGLLQTPVARAVPQPDGTTRYQLAFGHSRKTAVETLMMWSRDEAMWRAQGLPVEKCNPEFWNAMPLNVRTLTDREMAENAIVENAKRQDISAIEKAKALKRYCTAFKVTQREAAPLFGLKDAASVSHLLSLLDLPQEVQTLVDAGKLPEAHARTLITVSKYFPQQAIAAANKIAGADEAERVTVARSNIGDIWNKHAQDLHQLPWKEDWSPDAKLSTDMYQADKGEPALPPPCAKCEFAHQFGNQRYCARPACYNLKFRMHAALEAKRLSKAKGIAVVQPSETVTILVDPANVDYRQIDKMQKVVKKASRLPSLRLVPMTDKPTHTSYYVKDVTGSHYVLLGTTNKAEIERALSPREEKGKPAIPASETAAQKKARLEREEREDAERYQERCDANKVKYDVLWMLEYVSNECARQMQISGGILIKTETLVHSKATFNPNIEELKALHQRLRSQVYSEMWTPTGRAPTKPVIIDAEIEQLRRTHIIFDLLCDPVIGYRNVSETFKWGNAQTETERIITQTLCLNLPKDWNVPPVHKTACNCWHCGKFCGNENGPTKKEQAAGWIVRSENAGSAVFCSWTHSNAYDMAHAQAEVKAAKKGKAKK